MRDPVRNPSNFDSLHNERPLFTQYDNREEVKQYVELVACKIPVLFG